MKRTENINMGQRLFVIDEDAYNLLNEYIESLHTMFDNTPGQEETAADIEYRIAELLGESLEVSGNPSVSLSQVQGVIAQMGRPEEILETEEVVIEESDSSQQRESATPPPPPFAEEPTVRKRFYRDPEDRIIGGVCSGIAAYFGVDVAWVRVAAILLAICSFSVCAIVYVVLCCVVPEAKTPLQRMQLYGEAPTIENLGRNFTDMASGAFQSVKGYTERNRSGITEFFRLVVKFFACVGIVIGSLIGVCCLFAMVVLIAVIIANVVTSIWPGWSLVPSWSIALQNMDAADVFDMIQAFFVLGCIVIPFLALGIGLYRSFRKKRTFSWTTITIWSIAWVVCLIVAIIIENCDNCF